jgi:hypothetical protein
MIANFCVNTVSFVSMFVIIDVSDPIVKEKKHTPNIIQSTHRIRSKDVPPDMSP